MAFFWEPFGILIAAPILWLIGLRKIAIFAAVIGVGLLYEAFSRPIGISGR